MWCPAALHPQVSEGMKPCTALLLLAAVAAAAADTGHTSRRLLDGSAETVIAAIANGYNAPKGRYPWIVTVRDKADEATLYCAGTLIHPLVVLTAAGCIVDPSTGKQYAEGYQVRIGGYYATQDAPADYEKRQVVKIVSHPDFVTKYAYNYLDYDVALLLLDQNSTKTPIQLAPAQNSLRLPLKVGTDLLAVGWGVNQAGEWAEQLQQIRMKLISQQDCQKTHGTTDVVLSNGKTVTIKRDIAKTTIMCDVPAFNYPNGVGGTCRGDGGGPHFLRGATPGQDVQYGIDSFGVQCGTGAVGTTNVAAVRGWIDRTLEQITSVWYGRVWGDPHVVGFDGRTSEVHMVPGTTLKIMNFAATDGDRMLFTAVLAAGPTKGTTVMRSLYFRWSAVVELAVLKDNSLQVLVGGKAMKQGGWMAVTGGSVRYRADKPNWNKQVTITQQGMSIRINQAWSKRAGAYHPWLDVWVFFNRVPKWPMGGVLGRTFPRELITKATASAGVLGSPVDASLVSTIDLPPPAEPY